MLALAWIARSTVALALVLGYLGAGAAAGVRLARRGHPLGLIASALIGWPLLAGALFGPPPIRTRTPIAGPFATRIGKGLASLRASLAEARSESPIELASPTQLSSLELALRLADERVAGVDRLIAELESTRVQAPSEDLERSLASLRGAREHAAAELEQVLGMLLAVRVQIGLHALQGPGTVAPVRERLAELEARVAALAELSSFDADRPSDAGLPMEGC
ncbi:hypothetical protein ACNOYE_32595 [Nannocystaceae bacterium ST9]